MEMHTSLEVFAENGRFASSRIVTALRTTSDEVARIFGLGRDARHAAGSDRQPQDAETPYAAFLIH